MRRRLARRSQLVRARTRAKNECHAVLVRRLIKKPGVSDLFGLAGREWLRDVELPVEERETVDGCLRQIEFLDREIAEVEKQIARDALIAPQIKRLMTVPGVNVIVAATSSPPSATSADFARRGRSSATSGSIRASVSRAARPRLTAGSQSKAQRPRGALRSGGEFESAQLLLGQHQGGRSVWSTNDAMRQAERALALQAERAYQRTVADWQSTTGASATPGRASQGRQSGKQRGKAPVPDPAL